MTKISIITPIYNVEDYLKRCIDSLLHQSLDDFELILVDDGSTDGSGEIADKYTANDPRVKVIHQENSGAAEARNSGIRVASGDYLYFPDPDDWIEPNYLFTMYNAAIKNDAQLVISGFTMEYFEGKRPFSISVNKPFNVLKGQEKVRNNIHKYFNNMMIAVPWNKLYESHFIKSRHLEFPNLKWDDLHFNLEVLKNIDNVTIISNQGYHFLRSRPGSETTTVFDGQLYRRRKEQFEHIQRIYQYWNLNNSTAKKVIYGYYEARLVQCIQEISLSSAKNKRELVSKIIRDPLTQRALREGEIGSELLELAVKPMKMGNVSLCILTGKLIGFVKVKMAYFFYQLKSRFVSKT